MSRYFEWIDWVKMTPSKLIINTPQFSVLKSAHRQHHLDFHKIVAHAEVNQVQDNGSCASAYTVLAYQIPPSSVIIVTTLHGMSCIEIRSILIVS